MPDPDTVLSVPVLPLPPAPDPRSRLPSLNDILNPAFSSEGRVRYPVPPWSLLPVPSKRRRDPLPPDSLLSPSPSDLTSSSSLLTPSEDFTPRYSMRSRHSFPYDPYSSRNLHQYCSDYEQDERSVSRPNTQSAQYEDNSSSGRSAYPDASAYRSFPPGYHEEEARRRHSVLGYPHTTEENYESHAYSHEPDPETTHPPNALPPPPPTTHRGPYRNNYPNPIDVPSPSHQRFTQIYPFQDPIASPSTPAPVPPHQFHVIRFQPQPAQSPSPPPHPTSAPTDSTNEAPSPRASRSDSPLSRDSEPISTPQGYLCRICATAPTATTTPSGAAPVHPRPPKIYANLGALRLHVKLVHEKGRRFVCETCGNQFFRKQDLERHLATHLPVGYKPFQCGCGVRFTRRDALVRHVKAQRCG